MSFRLPTIPEVLTSVWCLTWGHDWGFVRQTDTWLTCKNCGVRK